MSYFSNPRNIGPGPIHGSALDGLCTRVAISCTRVLDSACKQLSLENTRLSLGVASRAMLPLAFQTAKSTQIEGNVSGLKVTRLEGRPCFARIECDVTVPLKVNYRCDEGIDHMADSSITVHEDIVMYVPEASVFPFEVVASASCNAPNGRFEDDQNFTCTACITIITKVVAETDLLIPAYGFCPSPKAVDFESEVCNKFFDLPLYPSGRS